MGSIDHIFSSMEPGSALAARGEMSFSGLPISAWIGGVVGDNIGYAIGRKFGRKVILQYGEKIGLNNNRLMQVEAVVRKYGPFTVMFARFFNGLRLSTAAMSMSPTGPRLSKESAPRPFHYGIRGRGGTI